MDRAIGDRLISFRSGSRKPARLPGWGMLANLANMTDPVNMHEAKTELSRLVERALAGEDVVIARAGVPVVRLVPVITRGKRKLGQWAGRVVMTDDFDAPLRGEDLDAWEGKT